MERESIYQDHRKPGRSRQILPGDQAGYSVKASLFSFLFLLLACCIAFSFSFKDSSIASTYYIDSQKGDDRNKGTNVSSPWKTLSRLSKVSLKPGDTIRFKRGSSFTGPLVVRNSGTASKYITLTDYGVDSDPAPAFTNPVFEEGNYGNCIRLGGSYIVVENLYFSKTAAYKPIKYSGEGWDVWEMGAIHIERDARHCIVRNNEIVDCVAGIRSNGEYAIIEYNNIRDCNRILREWNWGPIGIWLGADYQEVRYNSIINYSAVHPKINWGPDAYGSGADGSAFEIDDARYDKTDIAIHHNYTRDCQGFLEVTWTDVKQKPHYAGFRIHHNVSDDYQQFIALWRGEACRIENNTIIRRKVNANEWGVFNITQFNSRNLIRNNIIVVENNVVVFNLGRKGNSKPGNIISHNLYYAMKDSLQMGKEGPGESAVFGDPLFVNYEHAKVPEDYRLRPGSPAIGKGLVLGYESDFAKQQLPREGNADIGAFQFKERKSVAGAGNAKAVVMPLTSSPGHNY